RERADRREAEAAGREERARAARQADRDDEPDPAVRREEPMGVSSPPDRRAASEADGLPYRPPTAAPGPPQEGRRAVETGARSAEADAPEEALMRLYLVTIPVIILPDGTRNGRTAQQSEGTYGQQTQRHSTPRDLA